MITSNQLRKTDRCEFNPNSKLKNISGVVRDAAVQKSIVKRALMGEPIDNYASELENCYGREGKVWETAVQLSGTCSLQAARIKRFVDWEMNNPERQNKKFLRDLIEENGGPIVVNVSGTEVEARPDYMVETDDRLYVCRIKTGRCNGNTADTTRSLEALALGEAGTKFAHGKDVVVQYLFLGDKDEASERLSLTPQMGIPYDSTDKKYNKIMEDLYNDRMRLAIIDADLGTDHSCSPEDCAMCSQNNICHFEEPPIPAPVTESVRPLGDIRLSHDQEAVIDYERGTARVNAGPGSGKTLVTSLHFERLIEKGYDPSKFCLLTFTNAGAGEMTARTINYAAEKGHPVDPDSLTSTTFNAFCQDIINTRYEQLGFTRRPRVIDDSSKRNIINRLFDQFPHISTWKYTGSAANERVFRKESSQIAYIRASLEFGKIKKEGYTRNNYPSEWDRNYKPEDLDILFMMYDEFNKKLKEKNYLEFDDQIIYVNQLYDQDNTLFEQLGYEHIVVDEFQDTDYPQIQLLQKMRDTTCFKSLMCVGDDSQSIFAFRHTSPEYMVNFDQYFGRFDDFSLVENHRSNRATITFANKVNDLAEVKVDKELIATKPEGFVPSVEGFYTSRQEYRWIAEDIKQKWDAGKRDIAVIMSDRNQLTAVADALTRLGIPSTLKSPVPMISNSRIRALMTFYDSFMGNGDQGFADYQNILAHGALKGKTAAQIEEIADSFKGQVVQFERTKENFLDFAKALDVAETDECYQKFLERFEECDDMSEVNNCMENFKLYGKEEMFKREGVYEGVCLTTIHSAKGLEWDITYLCVDKLDDTKYHNRKSYYSSNGEYDEQIRKMFVGSTRAREKLIITGQYVIKNDSKTGEMLFNDFLRTAHEFVGKVWGYSYAELEVVKAQEKAEDMENNLSRSRVHALGSTSEEPVRLAEVQRDNIPEIC